MRSSLLLALALFGCSGKADDSAASADGPWLMAVQDLGQPVVGSPDADLSDPSPLWFVSEQFLPGLEWDDPTVDIPLFVIESIAMDTGVADSGSCPYEQIDGSTTTWRSDCRSTQGYNWTGRVVRERWESGGVTYTRWDSDLTVEGDVDDPEFDRLSVQGAWVYASGDDTTLVTGIQGNVEVALAGYWSRAQSGDEREAAWSDWAWSGMDELHDNGQHHVEGTGRLGGGVGTLAYTSSNLTVTTACDTSPTGEVSVSGAQSVDLSFHGETDCRQCATVSSTATEVCAR